MQIVRYSQSSHRQDGMIIGIETIEDRNVESKWNCRLTITMWRVAKNANANADAGTRWHTEIDEVLATGHNTSRWRRRWNRCRLHTRDDGVYSTAGYMRRMSVRLHRLRFILRFKTETDSWVYCIDRDA